MEGPVLEVIVGPNKRGTTETWFLPKSLLSHHSTFFRSACNSQFKEGIESRMTLPNDNPGAFIRFVEWMYLGEVYLAKHDVGYEGGYRLVDWWILADKLGAEGFADYAMQALYAFYLRETKSLFEPELNLSLLEDVLDYTTASSKLRLFFTHVLIAYWDDRRVNLTKHREHEDTNTMAWDDIFDNEKDFRDTLLGGLLQSAPKRYEAFVGVEKYLHSPINKDESVKKKMKDYFLK